MRALFVSIGITILFSMVLAQPDLPDFVPCSFSVSFKSNIFGPEGDVLASSTDRFIRDNENDLWRWDSDFTGMAPLVDPQQFIIIWRSDLNTSYHDYGDKCLKNDGHAEMAPLPYDWLLSKTYGMSWFRHVNTWEGLPSYTYHATFHIVSYNGTMDVEIHTLQSNGALVFINGTAKSEEHGIDVSYAMQVESFEQHQEVLPIYFIPSAHCNDGVPVPAPPAPTPSFEKECYGWRDSASSAGFRTVASWSMVLVLLLVVAVLLF